MGDLARISGTLDSGRVSVADYVMTECSSLSSEGLCDHGCDMTAVMVAE
ncbi:MAG: hypothetical protein IPK60_16095 [Sandaracinaceae bacterium]|nr:hypothetical protein [Sandaracinaceae bacterium]